MILILQNGYESFILLVDDNRLDWDLAWDITTKSIAYTNHTLLPEALEKWDLEMFGNLLQDILR